MLLCFPHSIHVSTVFALILPLNYRLERIRRTIFLCGRFYFIYDDIFVIELVC